MYQAPLCQVMALAYTQNVLEEASTVVVPGGGSGVPDLANQGDEFWDDEDYSAPQRSDDIWDDGD